MSVVSSQALGDCFARAVDLATILSRVSVDGYHVELGDASTYPPGGVDVAVSGAQLV